jgi:hypothetical protein
MATLVCFMIVGIECFSRVGVNLSQIVIDYREHPEV